MNQLIFDYNLEIMCKNAINNQGLEAIEVLKIKVNGIVERVKRGFFIVYKRTFYDKTNFNNIDNFYFYLHSYMWIALY